MKRVKMSAWGKVISLILAILILSLPSLAQVIEAKTSEQQNAVADAERQAQLDANQWTFFVLGIVGTTLTLLIVAIMDFKPPQSAILGKSPEYAAAYSDAYSRKIKSIRLNYTIYGCLTGVGAWALLYLALFAAASSAE